MTTTYQPCGACGKKPVNRHGVIALYKTVIENRFAEVCESCAFKKK